MTSTAPSEDRIPSGYSTHDEYWGSCFTQGGREVYSVDLSLSELVATVPRPDPEEILQDNRKIEEVRAERFAEYLLERDSWVYPPLMFRVAPGEFEFERKIGAERTSTFGYLKIPRLSRHELKIIDGQHRSLGTHIAWERINDRVSAAREALARAKRLGEPSELIEGAQRQLERELRLRDRLGTERVRLDIIVVQDGLDARQIFVDIADNAKGVRRDLVAMFDQTKVVNRVMLDPAVWEHPLLQGRIEEGRSGRMGKKSEKLIGAKNVADIVRALQAGTGRISARREDELSRNERTVVADTVRFFDELQHAFPELDEVARGALSPTTLRETSILGSETMLRILAIVHHELRNPADSTAALTETQIQEFFSDLAPLMRGPVGPDDKHWLETGVFIEGSKAPVAASGGVIKKLVATLVDWARQPGSMPSLV